MPEVIPCPACGHQVRVPESLFGQPVRCPSCKSYFTAPTRDSYGNLGSAELLSEPPSRSVEPESPRIPEGGSPILLPAILLLLVGILGTLVNGFQAVQTLNDPEGSKRRMIDTMRKSFDAAKAEFDEKAVNQAVEMMPAVQTAFFAVSVVTLLGGIAMLSLRAWWLAIFGGITAMVNIGSCCCVIGVVVGIYCLIKLLNPEVKSLFFRT